MKSLWLQRIVALLIGVFLAPAYGQQPERDFPSRPIRLVVPLPPGAAVDSTARIVATKLGIRIKQQVVVENMAGASGVIGTETVARAAPNGYTLLFATPTAMVIGPLINKKLPYHPVRDFEPVSLVVSNPLLLVVTSSLPVNTPAELIVLAKSKPGGLNYGTAGEGTPSHIAFELLMSMAGVDMVHVPYKGGGQAQIDLVSGRVQMYLASIPGVGANVRAGKLKAIAVTTSKRAGAMPDVPTLAESGLPGYEFDTWYAIFAPAKTAPSTVSKLNSELVVVLSDAEFVKSMAGQGSDVRSSTPAALGGIVRSESERLGKLIEKMGLVAQ